MGGNRGKPVLGPETFLATESRDLTASLYSHFLTYFLLLHSPHSIHNGFLVVAQTCLASSCPRTFALPRMFLPQQTQLAPLLASLLPFQSDGLLTNPSMFQAPLEVAYPSPCYFPFLLSTCH